MTVHQNQYPPMNQKKGFRLEEALVLKGGSPLAQTSSFGTNRDGEVEDHMPLFELEGNLLRVPCAKDPSMPKQEDRTPTAHGHAKSEGPMLLEYTSSCTHRPTN